MNNLPGLLFVAFSLLAGVVLFVGARQKWAWLVDPPDKMWLYYSQAFVKKLFGRTFTIRFTYFLGIMFIVFALFGLINGLRGDRIKAASNRGANNGFHSDADKAPHR